MADSSCHSPVPKRLRLDACDLARASPMVAPRPQRVSNGSHESDPGLGHKNGPGAWTADDLPIVVARPEEEAAYAEEELPSLLANENGNGDDSVSDISCASYLSNLSGEEWKPASSGIGPISWVQQQIAFGTSPRDILTELVMIESVGIKHNHDYLLIYF